MAGGKGTRIAQVNATVPKPMIPIEGKPILEYQIETLKKQGYTDIILIVGHMGNVIQKYFGDGSAFGVQISYIYLSPLLSRFITFRRIMNYLCSSRLKLKRNV